MREFGPILGPESHRLFADEAECQSESTLERRMALGRRSEVVPHFVEPASLTLSSRRARTEQFIHGWK